MPTIIFFPLLPFIFEVGLVIYWVAVTALLYSAGDLTAHCRSAEAGASASLNFKQYANVSNIKSTYDSVTNFDLNTAVSNAVNNSINGFLNGTAAASLNGTRDVCYANVSRCVLWQCGSGSLWLSVRGRQAASADGVRARTAAAGCTVHEHHNTTQHPEFGKTACCLLLAHVQ